MAYFECVHELKLIVDLINEGGISDMRYSISNTAEYGDLTRGPRLVTKETKDEMKKILSEIQDGSFANEFLTEFQSGKENFKRMEKEGEDHLVERVGKKLRSMFSWIKEGKIIDRNRN